MFKYVKTEKMYNIARNRKKMKKTVKKQKTEFKNLDRISFDLKLIHAIPCHTAIPIPLYQHIGTGTTPYLSFSCYLVQHLSMPRRGLSVALITWYLPFQPA